MTAFSINILGVSSSVSAASVVIRRLNRAATECVVVDAAVVDAAVPRSLVYGESRMDAVEDLLTVVDAAHRMGPDGAMQIVEARFDDRLDSGRQIAAVIGEHRCPGTHLA